jgi:16S rRNA (uracil1498-N3)-methyltransferase
MTTSRIGESPDDESAFERAATTKYTLQFDVSASHSDSHRATLGDANTTLRGIKCHPNVVGGLCKPRQKFLLNLLFSLDSKAKEIYTLVSCIAASMVNIDWERRQTQPKAKQQKRQHTRGTPKRASPEVFLSQCSSWFSRTLKILRTAVFLNTMTRRRWIADTFTDTNASLTGDQALHLARVLRAQPGQIFDVVANGFLRRATVVNVSEQEVTFELGEELETEAALPVHLLLAIIKFDHYEWGLEKLTELGAARITPVVARRTEKHLALAASKRVERWRRIALEAAKQSRRSDLPQVDDPLPLKQAMAQVSAPTKLLLAETEQENSLAAALEKHTSPGEIALAIGPEGGWTPEEMKLFSEGGWSHITLGPRILRAETAAIAALSICSALL